MLLPNVVHPQNSIYYTGALVLQELQREGTMTLSSLYVEVKSRHGLSFSLLLLSLDWLFLIDVAVINEKGEIELCS